MYSRRWNISNTIKHGPRSADNSGQTRAGEFPIACTGISCNKDDSRGSNLNSVSGDLIANRVGMSKTSTGRWGAAPDRANKSMPPDLHTWRRRGRSISPQVGWNKLERFAKPPLLNCLFFFFFLFKCHAVKVLCFWPL